MTVVPQSSQMAGCCTQYGSVSGQSILSAYIAPIPQSKRNIVVIRAEENLVCWSSNPSSASEHSTSCSGSKLPQMVCTASWTGVFPQGSFRPKTDTIRKASAWGKKGLLS